MIWLSGRCTGERSKKFKENRHEWHEEEQGLESEKMVWVWVYLTPPCTHEHYISLCLRIKSIHRISNSWDIGLPRRQNSSNPCDVGCSWFNRLQRRGNWTDTQTLPFKLPKLIAVSTNFAKRVMSAWKLSPLLCLALFELTCFFNCMLLLCSRVVREMTSNSIK